MSWDIELVIRLRYLINDIDSVIWTDDQLKVFLGIASSQIGGYLSRWGVPSFVYSNASGTITPDPTESNDYVQSLIVIKAAEIIARSELKKASASAGFIVVDDQSRIDTKQVASNLKEIVDNLKQETDNAIRSYKENNRFNGKAVLAPYADANGSIPFIQWPSRIGWYYNA